MTSASAVPEVRTDAPRSRSSFINALSCSTPSTSTSWPGFTPSFSIRLFVDGAHSAMSYASRSAARAGLCLEVAQERIHRGRVAKHELGHESEDRIVDLAVFGDRQIGSASRGSDP